jgi:hypothetical protein
MRGYQARLTPAMSGWNEFIGQGFGGSEHVAQTAHNRIGLDLRPARELHIHGERDCGIFDSIEHTVEASTLNRDKAAQAVLGDIGTDLSVGIASLLSAT